MADLATIESALRNADAAGDTVAARRLAQLYRETQAQMQPEEPGFFARIGEAFTGAARQTPETQALPELTGTGFGLDPSQQAQVAGLALLTPDPVELGHVLSAQFPFIQTRQDAKGNVIATNTQTGEQAVLNQPGLSMQDITSFVCGKAEHRSNATI